MTHHDDHSDGVNEAVRMTRHILQRATGTPASNEALPGTNVVKGDANILPSKPFGCELPTTFDGNDDARRRVDGRFGQALLGIAVIPFVASSSDFIDFWWRVALGTGGLVMLVAGAFYVDRANASDKAKLK